MGSGVDGLDSAGLPGWPALWPAPGLLSLPVSAGQPSAPFTLPLLYLHVSGPCTLHSAACRTSTVNIDARRPCVLPTLVLLLRPRSTFGGYNSKVQMPCRFSLHAVLPFLAPSCTGCSVLARR